MPPQAFFKSSKGMIAMRIDDPAGKKYLREVGKALPCGRKERKRILEDLCQSITNESQPGKALSYEELVARMGTPEEIAFSCLSEKESRELLKELKTKNRNLKILLATAAAAIAIWIGYWAVSYISLMDEFPGYIVEGAPVVVEQYEIPSEGDNAK